MPKKAKSKKAKSKTVSIELTPPELGPLRCNSCQGPVYRHMNGGYWCEECGERKTKEEITDTSSAD